MTKIDVDNEDDAIAIIRLAKQKGVLSKTINRETGYFGGIKVVVKDKYQDKVSEALQEYNGLEEKEDSTKEDNSQQ